MISRRFIATLLIPLVAFWSVVVPYRVARAGVVVAFPAAPVIVEAVTAAGPIVMNPATAVAVLVGVAVWYFVIRDSATGNALRVPAGTAANNTVPAPAVPATVSPTGSACMYTSPWTSQPVSSGQYVIDKNCGLWGSCSNTIPTCAQWHFVSETAGCSLAIQERADAVSGCSGSIIANLNVSGAPVITCPAGYVVSNGTCVLTNARQSSQDGKVDVQRTGQVYQTYPGDDTGTVKPTITQTSTAGDTVRTQAKDANGNPQVITSQATAAGTVLNVATQKADANGNTYIQNQTYNFDLNGNIQNATQTAKAEMLTPDANGNLVTTASAASNFNPASSQGSQLTFPSDYARAGEAAAAASAINTSLGPKLDKLLETSPAPSDPTLPDPGQYTDFGSTFNSLTGWSVPGHSSQCPTSSFSAFGKTFTIDSHCTLWADHSQALQAAMMVVWTIAALWVVLKA